VLSAVFERDGVRTCSSRAPSTLRTHANQYSFPRARDAEDATALHTALRATEEELA
jgi:hypothetical protein